MNVTNKTVKTFAITDITEDQAQDLLTLACVDEIKTMHGETFKSINETLNNLRQSLLSAGVTRSEGVE